VVPLVVPAVVPLVVPEVVPLVVELPVVEGAGAAFSLSSLLQEGLISNPANKVSTVKIERRFLSNLFIVSKFFIFFSF
jgi:hypothetical protein